MGKVAETRTCPNCNKEYIFNLEKQEGGCKCIYSSENTRQSLNEPISN